MKMKNFVAREIQYFELRIFSFNLFVYYVTRGFIASTGAFNLPTRDFSLLTRGFELVTRRFELVTHRYELVTRIFEIVTRGFELVNHGLEIVTRNSCFTFPNSTSTSRGSVCCPLHLESPSLLKSYLVIPTTYYAIQYFNDLLSYNKKLS